MNNEYCHATVNGEDLDDYLDRTGIQKKYPQPTEAERLAEQVRSERELARACMYFEARQRRVTPKPRSDGKVEIKQKFERCMTKAQRRQKKIDRRKNHKHLTFK